MSKGMLATALAALAFAAGHSDLQAQQTPLPDLAFTSLGKEREHVRIDVVNQGAAASAATIVGCVMTCPGQDRRGFQLDLQALAPSAQQTLHNPWRITTCSTEITVECFVDQTNLVPETNDSNNSIEIKYRL
jgi:hypothetical protein